MLVVITGSPGVGKSAVAKVLAKKIGAAMLDLKDIARKRKILIGYDSAAGSMIINEKKISSAVGAEIKKGDYVLDSHLGQFMAPRLVKLMVVLRCNPSMLEKRLGMRNYSKEKVAENVLAEYIDVCLLEAIKFGHKKHLHEIDTTHRNAGSVADEIIAVLNGKRKKHFGDTKWLK